MRIRKIMQPCLYLLAGLAFLWSLPSCQKQGLTASSLTIGPAPGPPGNLPPNLPIIHWTKGSDVPVPAGMTGRAWANGFSIYGKGYVCGGMFNDNNFGKDTWQYDPASGSWSQVADFPEYEVTIGSSTFTIGYNAYLAGGDSQEFWQYNQTGNVWTRKADFPDYRIGTSAFALGNTGYVGLGLTGVGAPTDWGTTSWYAYSPAYDQWTKKADLPGHARAMASSFVYAGAAYICAGAYLTNHGNSYFHDLWEYYPANDVWVQRASLPGDPRYFASGFSTSTGGVIAMGSNPNKELVYNDCWKYSPVSDSWSQMPSLLGGARMAAAGFAIGNTIYVGGGEASPDLDFSQSEKDFWSMNFGN